MEEAKAKLKKYGGRPQGITSTTIRQLFADIMMECTVTKPLHPSEVHSDDSSAELAVISLDKAILKVYDCKIKDFHGS